MPEFFSISPPGEYSGWEYEYLEELWSRVENERYRDILFYFYMELEKEYRFGEGPDFFE